MPSARCGARGLGWGPRGESWELICQPGLWDAVRNGLASPQPASRLPPEAWARRGARCRGLCLSFCGMGVVARFAAGLGETASAGAWVALPKARSCRPSSAPLAQGEARAPEGLITTRKEGRTGGGGLGKRRRGRRPCRCLTRLYSSLRAGQD